MIAPAGWRWAWPVLLGAASTLAFAPFDLWPLAVLCPLLMMRQWRAATPRQAALRGFGYGVGLFAAGTWWLYISIHDMNDSPAWLALLLVGALVLSMALYYALTGWLLAKLYARCSPGPWCVGAAALWLLLEWLRGWLFTGFPWLQLGYSQVDTWLAGWAPLIGSQGLGAWLLAVAALLLWATGTGVTWRQRGVALLLATLPWLGGRLLQPLQWTAASGEPVTVAVLQGAVPQSIKWLTTNRDPTRQLYHDLNNEALGAKLILWPEAAVTELANQIPQYLGQVLRESRLRGSDVVMGILRMDDRGEDVYNSMLALTSPLQFYDKQHLVPYSEYFPVPDWVRGVLQRLDLPYSDITHGAADQPPLHAGGLNIGATICYEDAFGHALRGVLRQADVLANVTNDAWFGRSPARYQHFENTRMRAIEAQRWLIRAANDGISAIVGPDGKVVQSATEFQPAVLRGTVTPRRGLTPYARFGDWPVLAAAVLALLASFMAGRLRALKRMSGDTINASQTDLE